MTLGRPRLSQDLKTNLTQKHFYFPVKKEYDIIWAEFVKLSNIKCSGDNPDFFRPHKERRVCFVLRRLVFQFVLQNTVSSNVKEMITQLTNKEKESNKKAYEDNR